MNTKEHHTPTPYHYDDKIMVPGLFFSDHEDRGLPSPKVVQCQGKGLWIRRDDPATKELLADAEHYAHRDGPTAGDPSFRSLRASAKLTAERIRSALSFARSNEGGAK